MERLSCIRTKYLRESYSLGNFNTTKSIYIKIDWNFDIEPSNKSIQELSEVK